MMRVLLTSHPQDQMFRNKLKGDDIYSSIETLVAYFESGSSSEEKVEITCPINDHHETTTLVDVPVDHQPDNATLNSTTFVDVPVEVLLSPQVNHMITKHKAKEHHLSHVACSRT